MMKFRKLLTLLLIPISFYSCSKKNYPADQNVKIYLISANGTASPGKRIGCNEILVPVTQNISEDGNLIEETLNCLLAAKDTGEFRNYVKGPQLLLFQVNLAGGVADIYFKGDLQINGVCDIPRISEQINETIKQFVIIKKVNIYINNQTLDTYLDIAKAGFK
jgi:hypothetical protein